MNLLSKLERKYGRYAITGLMRYFVILYAVGFAISQFNINIYYQYLALDIGNVLKGEVWRLLTWLAYPPSMSILFGLLMIYLYFNLGNTLEAVWGSFRFNVFMFMGIFFHILAAFIIYFVFGDSLWIFTPNNLNLSIFLAFALTFPDMQFNLYFVLPIKAKILAGFYLIIEAYSFIVGAPAQKVTIFLSLLNFFIFYLLSGRLRGLHFHMDGFKRAKRKEDFRKKVKIVPHFSARHKCAVCGKTEADDETLEFRYCSKCKGNKEYCTQHIFTHVHTMENEE